MIRPPAPPVPPRVAAAVAELLEARAHPRRRTVLGWLLCPLGWHRWGELLDSGLVERCRDCPAVRIVAPAEW